MNEIIEYVAATSENEARMRYEAGLARETQTEAERDATVRNNADRCDPKCHFTVWRARTTLEPM